MMNGDLQGYRWEPSILLGELGLSRDCFHNLTNGNSADGYRKVIEQICKEELTALTCLAEAKSIEPSHILAYEKLHHKLGLLTT